MNAYGARLVRVETLRHRQSLRWHRVTWETADGRTRSANTFPGGPANHQVEALREGATVDVLVNGRGQVVVVQPSEQ